MEKQKFNNPVNLYKPCKTMVSSGHIAEKTNSTGTVFEFLYILDM